MLLPEMLQKAHVSLISLKNISKVALKTSKKEISLSTPRIKKLLNSGIKVIKENIHLIFKKEKSIAKKVCLSDYTI